MWKLTDWLWEEFGEFGASFLAGTAGGITGACLVMLIAMLLSK